MKNYRVGFLAAFLCILALSAVVYLHPSAHQLAWLTSGLSFLAGAVVVTYKYPTSGTPAPTIAQALNCNELNALVTALDADTIITIVHNWQLPSGDATSLFPIVLFNLNGDATTTLYPVWIATRTDSNTVTINKPTTVGSQGTFVVTLLRPNTLVR